jgi:uncharacterized protein (TIGR02145 family)
VEIGEQVWMSENLAYEATSGSWCYGDQESNCLDYGRLYDWPNATRACAGGWRLPSEEDWDLLNAALEPNAGQRLKQGGNSGFEAKMAGYRTYEGGYADLGSSAQFWTSSQYTEDHSWARVLLTIGEELLRTGYGHPGGASVRCLKN